MRTVPLENRGPAHFARQPFGQVPFLSDGEIDLFESGACLLHLARKSEMLMPTDPAGEAQVLQWVIAALNSVEMVTVPWWFLEISGAKENSLTGWMQSRLTHMETVLSQREWLAADRFTVADLLMADVLRVDSRMTFVWCPLPLSRNRRIARAILSARSRLTRMGISRSSNPAPSCCTLQGGTRACCR